MKHSNWLVHFLEKGFKNRFLFAKTTHLPWIGRLVYSIAFEEDHIVYLPKPRVISVHHPVAQPASLASPSRIIEHFIAKADHHWIMNFCICRESTGCRDYPIELGCLFMGEAVLKIDKNLGRLVTRDQALQHVHRCREAGLVHLIGRNKLDTLWLNARPGNRLLTVCNCCPCCCLWKMLPHLNPLINSRITKLPGLEVMVTERCSGCGTCTKNICFVNAIHMKDGKAVISADCRGCGRCTDACPDKAIRITLSDRHAIHRTIRSISAVVDVN